MLTAGVLASPPTVATAPKATIVADELFAGRSQPLAALDAQASALRGR
jgi:hypothetical protein